MGCRCRPLALFLSLAAAPFLPARQVELAVVPAQARWEEHVFTLIEQLGDDDFERREAAQRALLREGARVVPLLEKRLDHKDTEVRSRLARVRYELVGYA